MIQIPWLKSGDRFPPTYTALLEPNGLLAGGGDLSLDTMLNAYRHGIFPWFSEGDPILWWSPAPRTILWPKRLHISRSLKKVLRSNRFESRINSCFDKVVAACANTKRPGQDGSWITSDIEAAYIRLHRAGYAHSYEVFLDQQLVGGLYGIQLGAMFFGESMFSLESNASKVALVHLCQQPSIRLIDCQMATSHLFSLGATEVSRERFERVLKLATAA